MGGEKIKFREYKPEWNLEAFNAIEEVDVVLKETEPTQSFLMEYGDMDEYRGITIVIDNIDMKIYVWVSEYAKHKGWTKKVRKTTDPKKFSGLVLKAFAELLRYDMRNYEIIRIDEGRETEDFQWLWMYELASLKLYQQHYPKTEYMEMFQEREERLALEKAQQSMSKCPHCGWLLTGTKEKCPKCGKEIK